ncbi:MAG: invasion associated locus B family protein [Pseudobdellovibrionaceae bacterium]
MRAISMPRLSLLAGLVLLGGLSAPHMARADDPQLLGKHGAWSAYTLEEDGKKVCYMVSRPIKDEGKYAKRGDIFALITHRPAENTRDVFSYMTGYKYKPGSDVTVSIDTTDFSLFTNDETAWAPDPATDTRIAAGIQKGSKMVVKGTSSRGTLTTDTFSLKGSGAAYEAISKACGV